MMVEVLRAKITVKEKVIWILLVILLPMFGSLQSFIIFLRFDFVLGLVVYYFLGRPRLYDKTGNPIV